MAGPGLRGADVGVPLAVFLEIVFRSSFVASVVAFRLRLGSFGRLWEDFVWPFRALVFFLLAGTHSRAKADIFGFGRSLAGTRPTTFPGVHCRMCFLRVPCGDFVIWGPLRRPLGSLGHPYVPDMDSLWAPYFGHRGHLGRAWVHWSLFTGRSGVSQTAPLGALLGSIYAIIRTNG